MLTADFFDGHSTRIRKVALTIDGQTLSVSGEDIEFRVPFSEVHVDERLGRAPRRLRFSDGAFCEVSDLDALDVLLSSADHRDGWVDRTQRQARPVLVCLAAVVALAFAGYMWALPWAATVAAMKVPEVVGRQLSVATLRALDGPILLPSALPEARQRKLSDDFHNLNLPGSGHPREVLLFRSSPQLGANAFTLPDGTIIILDELVKVVDDDQQILAAMCHELGHAHGRHGLRLLLQSSVLGTFLALYVGDFSSVLAVAPATLLHAKYSRKLEEQADSYAAAVLRFNGMSPVLLAEALKKLAAAHQGKPDTGYMSTHPAIDERVRHLYAEGR
jgi:Zn-dependent protease with chaperone function